MPLSVKHVDEIKAELETIRAKKEARKISSAHLNMDDVNAEVIRIKNSAKEKATKIVESSHLEASKLEARADENVNRMTEYILKMVMGVGVE